MEAASFPKVLHITSQKEKSLQMQEIGSILESSKK
jgi:hypothetical protein